ncbi:MAG: hypothetical protein MZV64_05055 [Ignavibacteriales bacterium]|nr:hypothetical protein [Ignavibacteriales bacterium]
MQHENVYLAGRNPAATEPGTDCRNERRHPARPRSGRPGGSDRIDRAAAR